MHAFLDHLHWPRARMRILFKLCLLVYKAPCYTKRCIPVSTVPNLFALRSAAHSDLVVPWTRLQLGNRAFCVAGPVSWNSLLLHSRSEPALSTFKNMPKTSFLTFLLHWLIFPEYEQRTLCGALVVTLSMLMCLIFCSYIIIIIIIILPGENTWWLKITKGNYEIC